VIVADCLQYSIWNNGWTDFEPMYQKTVTIPRTAFGNNFPVDFTISLHDIYSKFKTFYDPDNSDTESEHDENMNDT